jgi:hypothetical protein
VSLDRRRFLKYAGASAAVVGASALGLDYLLSPRQTSTSLTTLSSTSSSISSNSSMSVVESTSSTLPLSTLSDLDDLKSGYPELANELRKLPEVYENTQQSQIAIQRIATLALQSTDPEVKEAFQIILRGGTSPPLSYTVPGWNTELQALYWLAEQNEFKENDKLAQAIAMANGIWISLGTDEVRQAVYTDINDLLNFFRETNEIQKGFSDNQHDYQLEHYPLDALVALAWTGNDLGRGGHIHYCLISKSNCIPSDVPLNIHHFIENGIRNVNLKDYQWNTVSVQTLREMGQTVSDQQWLGVDLTQTVDNLESYFYVGPNAPGFDFAHWTFTEPNDGFIVVNGETTINHNMNNANFEFQHFTETHGGIGVCDDNMATINAFLKSRGIASTALVRTYGTVDGLNHTHAIYFDPISKAWKANQSELMTGFSDAGFSTNWNVYIFKPPVLQHNYFQTQPDSKQTFMIMLDLYYKMLGIGSDKVTEMFSNGAPSSIVQDWFFSED